ncbi:hypothetical protein fugu_015755 [Takifugu bimaculatus]|uniref:Protein KRI1 homolog n=1 Tax=Takifugu bimaculatus TaxID=433685 RepID=A0A4Z2BZJ8_9TELE|nr:hypothetical protein fugu_015755 [Takifugu bimaculatus]
MSEETKLKISSRFAQRYDKYRQKEELQRLKDRYGDQTGSDSSESSSEESEVELDPALEREFYRTLSLLKRKDPKIYQKEVKFYSEEMDQPEEKVSSSTKAMKPMYPKDYERKVILEKGGKYEDEPSEDEVIDIFERAASPSYIQEQNKLKESIQQFIQDSDDEEKEDKEGGGLLIKRVKTQKEEDEENAHYVEWLKGQTEFEEPEGMKDMKYLKEYWNDPELDRKERFLRDYILNKAYIDEDDERIPTYDEVVRDDLLDSEGEGEMFLEQQEAFERSYNFRFEEPGFEQIKTYPRHISTSVRSKDDRRKHRREEVKERKQKEKEQKREHLKQLKNLKCMEITEKLRRLQELTGNEFSFNEVNLEGEFDPQEHDQLMQKFFGDNYYREEDDEKPQFDEDFEEHWNWDVWKREDHEYHEQKNDASAPHCEDEDFNMDADYNPNLQTNSKKKWKKKEMLKKRNLPNSGEKRKKSHFAEVIARNKPVFDPNEKSFEQYLDEYYNMDYEDIIDDLPCRFRYRQVIANDFGLTADEILNADDCELNHWCSLKKTCMFRSDKEEKCDLKNFKIKAQNMKKKKEILKSIYSEKAKEEELERNQSDYLNKAEYGPDCTEETFGQTVRPTEDEEEEVLIPTNTQMKIKREIFHKDVAVKTAEVNRRIKSTWAMKKQKLSAHNQLMIGNHEFKRNRLRAYGLNPKRLFYRQLGKQKRKEREKQRKKVTNIKDL